MNTMTVPTGAIKCTCFDPSVSQGSTRNRQPPKSLALAFIKHHTSFIQDNVADMLNNNCTKHVTYHHCIWQNTKHLNISNDDQDLIPKSDRIDFKLYVSQEAKQSKEFATLKEDNDWIITNCQKSLK